MIDVEEAENRVVVDDDHGEDESGYDGFPFADDDLILRSEGLEAELWLVGRGYQDVEKQNRVTGREIVLLVEKRREGHEVGYQDEHYIGCVLLVADNIPKIMPEDLHTQQLVMRPVSVRLPLLLVHPHKHRRFRPLVVDYLPHLVDREVVEGFVVLGLEVFRS